MIYAEEQEQDQQQNKKGGTVTEFSKSPDGSGFSMPGVDLESFGEI